ncbi:MAG: tRNA dihydrouridine synthase DusB [Deltaproteobacteria bacterium]|nr:tRNA dihydrouridine synthase DusB [Deltaproteobacteria bacterium]
MNLGNLNLDGNIFLAPMAGITDIPYRRIMKRYGAALVYSEMISANGLIRAGHKTRQLMLSSTEEQPLGIQLFGNDPDTMAEATREATPHAQLIDLNFGCPAKKVIRTGAGSALMREPERIGQIVAAVRKATPLPLTVKIRAGWDSTSINYLEIARLAENEGADAVTLHPRTRSQGFGGKADWTLIRGLKEAIDIPVIGSGDIFTPEDGLEMMKTTGCDAIMVGRGSFGNPWLLKNIHQLQMQLPVKKPSQLERYCTLREHYQMFIDCYGPRRAVGHMRKHLAWYARGMNGAAEFRHKINRVLTPEGVSDAIDDFFGTAGQKGLPE